ncbi:ABC transporter ATP-binding protein [Streptomyces sp. NBS 14/10]|uniref:ABC transporter ATP-binding protein n=1 Tax=Streptomyces sp. NBS 14/10 TaxID=1945643 RepID=UPI000B8017BE|nr:ABC transporter ATP-binding protein [Streptomyces sp. NBS 14/10]KAK1181414.1 ABC transporter ATP-binding protein [Streptomyces sp. NBS 14/10]
MTPVNPLPQPPEARAVHKSFALRDHRVDVLRGADLCPASGRITALIGHSGSGKTTLLQILGLLLPPDSGSVRIEERDAWQLSDNERADLRRRRIGFVFQTANLLPQHSALRNVALPHPGDAHHARRAARELLDRVGLARRADHRPGELSAGEQQRVALARALVNGAGTVLADEPTGNLDADNERRMLRLFRETADEGRAVLLVTHSPAVADVADTVLSVTDGRVIPEARDLPPADSPTPEARP